MSPFTMRPVATLSLPILLALSACSGSDEISPVAHDASESGDGDGVAAGSSGTPDVIDDQAGGSGGTSMAGTGAMGSTIIDPVTGEPTIFAHPGTLNNQVELDFVKEQLAAGAAPWTSKFTQVKNIATEAPSGAATLNSRDNNEANASKADARGAYAAALAWHYTGDKTYADNAVAILNSWAGLTEFSGGDDQDKLQAGWIGALFGPAADLMLTYDGWAPVEINAVREMFRRAFYPQLEVASSWNGNVDLTQIDALLAIAVFNEDQAMFDLGISRLAARMPNYFYLTSDASMPTGDWMSPTAWVDGLTQETCRDNGHHAQYALSAAVASAEIAGHPGVDVYAIHEERLTAAMELMATQLNTGDIQGTCADPTTTSSRFDTFEIGYHHYATRMGLALPNTALAIENEIRPKGTSDWNIFYETLTHGDLP